MKNFSQSVDQFKIRINYYLNKTGSVKIKDFVFTYYAECLVHGKDFLRMAILELIEEGKIILLGDELCRPESKEEVITEHLMMGETVSEIQMGKDTLVEFIKE